MNTKLAKPRYQKIGVLITLILLGVPLIYLWSLPFLEVDAMITRNDDGTAVVVLRYDHNPIPLACINCGVYKANITSVEFHLWTNESKILQYGSILYSGNMTLEERAFMIYRSFVPSNITEIYLDVRLVLLTWYEREDGTGWPESKYYINASAYVIINTGWNKMSN